MLARGQQRERYPLKKRSENRDVKLFSALLNLGDQGGRGTGGDRGAAGTGKEPRRGLGSACMRYSPSGSHLAIGCKNGSLVIMAVETDGEDGGREDQTAFNAEQHGRANDALEEDGRQRVRADGVGKAYGEAEPTAGGKRRGGSSSPRISYRRIAHLKGHSSRVLHLDWTTDGRFVHTCGQDYQILHWEVLPPPPPNQEGGEDVVYGNNNEGDSPRDFHPRLFQRAFLLRDAQWATWSSTVGWPVQVRVQSDPGHWNRRLTPRHTAWKPTENRNLYLHPSGLLSCVLCE